MNNCCSDYISQCARLTYAVFSVRSRSGERLATLGLSFDLGYWQVDLCVGPSSSQVLEESRLDFDEEGELLEETFATELYYVALEAARLMNQSEQCH